MFGKIHRRVPAVVVLAMVRDTGALRSGPQLRDAFSACCISLSVRTMPTRSCMNSCSSYWI